MIPEWIEAVLHIIESWTCWLLFTFVNIYYMSSFLDSKFLCFPPHSIAVLVKLTTVSMAVTLCTELFTSTSTFVNSPLRYMYNESLTFHKTVQAMNVIYTTVFFIRLYTLLFMYLFLSLIPFCFLFMWRLVFYVIVIYKIFFLYTS